jgi:oligopeptide/dipeptide ABC transporter ATP-binding protein
MSISTSSTPDSAADRSSPRSDSAPVLRVSDLRVYYHTPGGAVRAVDGVTFSLARGQRLGLVGESGSGKSTIALALMRLIRPPGRIEGGQILLGETDLLRLSDDQMRRTRFARISLVPQGAMNSLNPVMRIKHQITDAIVAHAGPHGRLSQRELADRVSELMGLVGLRREVPEMYAHELSGGMKQRVCIAMAICLRPEVIVADEPTSALDVVVQRQVMETLESVQERLGASVILVGHDMGVMAQYVDTIAVMYAGHIVEISPVEQLFEEPLHPYTRLLISTLPSLKTKSTFRGIPGIPPSLLAPPAGCPFHPRCPACSDRCTREMPEYVEVRPHREVACHLFMSLKEQSQTQSPASGQTQEGPPFASQPQTAIQTSPREVDNGSVA